MKMFILKFYVIYTIKKYELLEKVNEIYEKGFK